MSTVENLVRAAKRKLEKLRHGDDEIRREALALVGDDDGGGEIPSVHTGKWKKKKGTLRSRIGSFGKDGAEEDGDGEEEIEEDVEGDAASVFGALRLLNNATRRLGAVNPADLAVGIRYMVKHPLEDDTLESIDAESGVGLLERESGGLLDVGRGGEEKGVRLGRSGGGEDGVGDGEVGEGEVGEGGVGEGGEEEKDYLRHRRRHVLPFPPSSPGSLRRSTSVHDPLEETGDSLLDAALGLAPLPVPTLAPPSCALELVVRRRVPLPASHDLASEPHFPLELSRWLTVAAAAYQREPRAFCAVAGIPEANVHTFATKADALRPGFVICTDDRAQAVVVAVRGTSSAKDVLTDLAGDAVPFLGGHAHEGMAYAARALLGETRKGKKKEVGDGEGSVGGIVPIVQHLVNAHPGYRLVVVGHSLGGGVATLLAMRLLTLVHFPIATLQRFPELYRVMQQKGEVEREEGGRGVGVSKEEAEHASSSALDFPFQRLPVHCYTYGGPSVVSGSLARRYAGIATQVINGHDLIPRLTIQSAAELNLRITAFKDEAWAELVAEKTASAKKTIERASTAALKEIKSLFGVGKRKEGDGGGGDSVTDSSSSSSSSSTTTLSPPPSSTTHSFSGADEGMFDAVAEDMIGGEGLTEKEAATLSRLMSGRGLDLGDDEGEGVREEGEEGGEEGGDVGGEEGGGKGDWKKEFKLASTKITNLAKRIAGKGGEKEEDEEAGDEDEKPSKASEVSPAMSSSASAEEFGRSKAHVVARLHSTHPAASMHPLFHAGCVVHLRHVKRQAYAAGGLRDFARKSKFDSSAASTSSPSHTSAFPGAIGHDVVLRRANVAALRTIRVSVFMINDHLKKSYRWALRQAIATSNKQQNIHQPTDEARRILSSTIRED